MSQRVWTFFLFSPLFFFPSTWKIVFHFGFVFFFFALWFSLHPDSCNLCCYRIFQFKYFMRERETLYICISWWEFLFFWIIFSCYYSKVSHLFLLYIDDCMRKDDFAEIGKMTAKKRKKTNISKNPSKNYRFKSHILRASTKVAA